MAIFDVGVKVGFTNHVSAGLRAISAQLTGLRADVDLTQRALTRLSLVQFGMGMLPGIGEVVRGLGHVIMLGDQINQQQQRMYSQGISAATVHRNYLAAVRAAASVEGTTVAGNLETLRTLYATVGSYGGACSVLPGVARDTWLLRQMGQSQGDIAALYRSIDMMRMGVGANGQMDPAKFQHALDLFVAGLNLVPHHLLSGTALYQFARVAQPIISLGGNPEAFLRDYFELIQQLGRTDGRGLAYMGIKLVGGQLTMAQEGTLLRLGLVAPSGIGGTKGHPFLKPGALVGYQELLHQGILAWFRDVMIPHMKLSMGGEATPEQFASLLRGLAGMPVTSQRALATLFNIAPMMNRFSEQLDKELPHLQETFDDYQKALKAQLGDLSAALDSFFSVLGLPAAKTAIPMVRGITGAFQEMTLVLGENQWLADAINVIAWDLAGFVAASAGIATLRGALAMMKVALPALEDAFGPFAAGGAAAIALRLLTSSAGLIGLAAGLMALGAVVSDPRLKFLVHEGETIVSALLVGKKFGPAAGIGAFLWPQGQLLFGPTNWINWTPDELIHYLRTGQTPSRFAPQVQASPSDILGHLLPPPTFDRPHRVNSNLPLPPGAFAHLNEPLPLPPIPPGRAPVQVTVHSAPNITLPLPPVSPADLRVALQYAIVHGMDAATLKKIAEQIAADQAYALTPLLHSAVRKSLEAAVQEQQKHARRRTLNDPGGAAAMGGL